MRRLTCTSFDGTRGLTLESAADPVAGPGEILVRTTAANVSFVDRLIVSGEYQIQPMLPFTPGVIGAGQVIATGPGVTHVAPGNRVVALKSDYGMWATHVVIPGWAAVPLPPNVPDATAAAAVEAYGTASYALEERGQLHPRDKVLVLGASGAVGAASVEVALHRNAEVVAYSSAANSWLNSSVRPQHVIDRLENPDLRHIMRERFPEGVDLVLDPVGGDLAEPALRSLAHGGRYLVVGFAGGHIARLPSNLILLQNRSVVGVDWAAAISANPARLADTLAVVMNRLARGVIHPPPPNLVSLDELSEVLSGPRPRTGLVRTIVTFKTVG